MNRHEKPPRRPGARRNEDEVRRLLRIAGRRPAPPEEDLAAIRSAARGAWEALLDERRGRQGRRFWAPARRALVLAAGLALAALAAFWWLGSERQPASGGVVARVERVSGSLLTGEETLAVAAEIAAGAELSTGSPGSGRSGRAALRMVDGQSVRLDQGTTVRLASASSLELVQGSVYIDSPPSEAIDRHLEVLTDLGTVVEIGTQFEVRLDADGGVLDVRVREGAVSVRHAGLSVTARLGEALTVRRDGSVSRSSVATDAAVWDWVLDIAPALPIEGRPLAEILERAAREMGWALVYAGEELERAATSILVRSSAEGLRPDEALEVALRGSGLEYEVRDTTLTVSRP